MNAYKIHLDSSIYNFDDGSSKALAVTFYFTNLSKVYRALRVLEQQHPNLDGLLVERFGSYATLHRHMKDFDYTTKRFGAPPANGSVSIERISIY